MLSRKYFGRRNDRGLLPVLLLLCKEREPCCSRENAWRRRLREVRERPEHLLLVHAGRRCELRALLLVSTSPSYPSNLPLGLEGISRHGSSDRHPVGVSDVSRRQGCRRRDDAPREGAPDVRWDLREDPPSASSRRYIAEFLAST